MSYGEEADCKQAEQGDGESGGGRPFHRDRWGDEEPRFCAEERGLHKKEEWPATAGSEMLLRLQPPEASLECVWLDTALASFVMT